MRESFGSSLDSFSARSLNCKLKVIICFCTVYSDTIMQYKQRNALFSN
jgi:hypothetical protein